ncbi:hypothetical protein RHECNPAF_2530018 [Rhizobium etli CNPAF512]|nr:hypothetical protein RHECNPAF_2530018 [Rhizobium etli CNPAF512]
MLRSASSLSSGPSISSGTNGRSGSSRAMSARAASSPSRAWRTGRAIMARSTRGFRRSEADAIADVAVALDIAVIERPGRLVVFARMPIKPRPALCLGERDEIVHQRPADALAARIGIDEQIFEIAVPAADPGALMREIQRKADDPAVDLGDAHRDRGGGIEDPPPRLVGDIGLDGHAVKVEIGRPELAPAGFVLRAGIAYRHGHGSVPSAPASSSSAIASSERDSVAAFARLSSCDRLVALAIGAVTPFLRNSHASEISAGLAPVSADTLSSAARMRRPFASKYVETRPSRARPCVSALLRYLPVRKPAARLK